jgi:NCS2 family nucleobase:cation symporter-2
MMAASHFGFPVVCGMVIFAGACEAIIGQLVNKLRKLFPAVVSGVVIMAVGVELGKIGLGVLFDDATAHDPRSTMMFATAVCVLVTMTALGVWARGLPRLLCALAGILIGYGISALFGLSRRTLRPSSRKARSLPFPIHGFSPSVSRRR